MSEDTAPLPAVPASGRPASGMLAGASRTRAGIGPGARPGSRARVTPVMWSGRTEPGDFAATQLLDAVQGGATRLVPRVGVGLLDAEPLAARTSLIGRPRGPEAGGDLPGRPFAGNDHEPDGGDDDGYEDDYDDGYDDYGERARERSGEPAHHARPRRNPGPVLMPLRIFLGGISIYAGMSKLCDPVFFDGGDRGSMVQWLSGLHPWAAAEPLRDLALAHPVGAGLTVAFLQIVVGMLSVLGLWQRAAAVVGMLLSAVLLLTVSWRSAPAYDAPDIIYLAAWSPLLIAGAPYYSLDGRLAARAWRKLGPRASAYSVRRWVLRRGATMTTVVTGLTLIIGSLLGGAVRSSTFHTDVPGPSDLPTNNQQGSPLPVTEPPGHPRRSHAPSQSPSSTPSADRPSPTHSATQPPVVRQPTAGTTTGSGAATAGAGQPTQGSGTLQQHQPPTQAPPSHAPDPAPPSGGSGSGSGSGGGGGGGTGGGSSGGALGGILGSDLLGMPGRSPGSSTSA
ncbi:membrane protein [Wenjunlia tyrosinilytica]|uniref:Membrane protein n=1 Tax=Wenjunlia tyrosinilytica TaxID=1544741 RepID=A0A918DWQ7_9ACTN|nr:membrane protein [Wenjunlia tyrosinilytica]